MLRSAQYPPMDTALLKPRGDFVDESSGSGGVFLELGGTPLSLLTFP